MEPEGVAQRSPKGGALLGWSPKEGGPMGANTRGHVSPFGPLTLTSKEPSGHVWHLFLLLAGMERGMLLVKQRWPRG